VITTNSAEQWPIEPQMKQRLDGRAERDYLQLLKLAAGESLE
jgi:hypothetical protein